MEVYLHIRPATADELGMDDCCVTVAGDQEVVLSAPRDAGEINRWACRESAAYSAAK